MRLLCLSAAIVVTTFGALRAEIIDRVLAVAAGEVIMLSDVTAARDLGLVKVEGPGDAVGPILAKLIDRELVLAEVEIDAEEEEVKVPDWLKPYVVREVTGEPEYVNVNLAK